jgi:hypothetical protein
MDELTKVEKLLKDTFAAHEHVAPDSDQVLAYTRERIERRRTVLSRPLAVAAGVVVLTLAAVTVVVLNRPTDKTQAAGPNGQAQPTTSVSTGPAIPELKMPYSLDWLPPGDVDYLVHRINVGGTAEHPDTPIYGGEYMFNVTNNGQGLYVDVQHFGMSTVDDAAFKSGPGRPVTINGLRGVESSVSDGPGGYELYVTHPGGGSMYVNVSAGHGKSAPTQLLVDTGRRIAEHIRFPGNTSVTPIFGLGELPSGMKICSFDLEKGFDAPDAPPGARHPSTGYRLGTCTTQPTINVYTADERDVTGTAGRPVQGHETRYVDENGYLKLFVLDAVKGAPVSIAGKVPLADLYDIGNRLILPN